MSFNIIFSLSLAIALLIFGCGESDPRSPIIFSVTSEPEMVSPGEGSTIVVEAGDPDSDELFYTWTVSAGTIHGDGKTVEWLSPETEGKYELEITVSDGSNSVSETVTLRVSRNYYPLTVGNTWTYKDSDGNTVNFEIVDTVDIEALGITTFVKQVTTSDLEEAANFSYIATSSDGVSQYGMGGSNAGGDTITFSPELPIYKLPPIHRESWSVDFDVKLEFGYFVGTGTATYEVISEDELTVEAGTFQHVFQTKEDFNWELEGDQIDHIITRHWLAPDVGIIKFTQEETIGGQTIITEASLQSYTVK
ncbi:PKD domain-containing protein [Candidatus Poribacteria bacterium]